jgi:acetyl-CoA carboxylase biotin carboxyl carrier protein
MDLTNEDVADVLALLDSLPYDELDLQTTRFRLTLRRTPDGWTQSTQVLAEPNPLEAPSGSTRGARGRQAPPIGGGGTQAPAGGTGAAGIPGARGPQAPPIGGGGTQAPAGGTGAAGIRGARGPQAPPIGGGGTQAPAGGAELGLVAVRAPLPGTFYRAPRPGAPPFVEVGGQVSTDTVIGIVETMKLMNSVPAGVVGTIAEICVANAEFAAQGATLLLIRADP